MSRKIYVLDYYVFVSRRGKPPNPWVWEIRRKSNPNLRSVADMGFRSATAAEEAGKKVLAEVRRAALADPPQPQARKIAAPKPDRKPPPTPEQRSEGARKAALARAKILTPERRSEIARAGGAASKGKPKIKRRKTVLDISKLSQR
jgi:hypothetical protein